MPVWVLCSLSDLFPQSKKNEREVHWKLHIVLLFVSQWVYDKMTTCLGSHPAFALRQLGEPPAEFPELGERNGKWKKDGWMDGVSPRSPFKLPFSDRLNWELCLKETTAQRCKRGLENMGRHKWTNTNWPYMRGLCEVEFGGGVKFLDAPLFFKSSTAVFKMSDQLQTQRDYTMLPTLG